MAPTRSAAPVHRLETATELQPLSEIISALTFALDLTEGAVPGHALRSCLLGMRLADTIGMSTPLQASLYYALLLKDCGCSSNASRMYKIVGGDDRALKSAAKLADWTKPLRPDARTLKSVWDQVAPGKALPLRTLRMMRIALTQHRNNRVMIEMRCNRGADIMRRLEMDDNAAGAVRHLDEHWDGSGYPEGLKGDSIPLFARLCALAQNLDVFYTEDGPDASIAVARARSGSWFDPELVRAAESLHAGGRLWDYCDPAALETTRTAVLALDPRMEAELSPERVDRICEAFAEVVDAKSPFTFRHSLGVANVATEIAEEMGMPPAQVRWLRRAALLHDVGKLSVPNSMLEKPGKLTDEEFAVLRLHPGLSRSILERISTFRDLAVIAGEHHEKLDGSGYPNGLRAEDLSTESRLLAVADIFAALAENRPYRPGFELAKCMSILQVMVPHQLDGSCFEALQSASHRWGGSMPFATSIADVEESNTCCWMPTPQFC